MQPVATAWFFYGLSALAILSGLAVITRKNPVHSALALIVTLLSVAGLYLMLYAPFIAGVQIILYVGGIMVLFLFVIMLVNLERNMREHQFNKQWLVATIAALALGGLFGYVYLHGKNMFALTAPAMAEQTNTQKMGEALYIGYTFPFEIASILLLVAIIGAVVMAKKRI